MTTKEEQIIKAIKHELSGLCLDIELNSDIDFNKQDIYGKLYSRYNFTSAEISQALKNYQSNSTDPYLFPFSFSCKGNYIIPLNEIPSILKYCKKNFNAENPPKNLSFAYSLLTDLLSPTNEANYEAHRQKALSLLTQNEIEECNSLYKQYNELFFEIFKYKAKSNASENYEEIIKYAKTIFMT